jgi:hypothetical protein
MGCVVVIRIEGRIAAGVWHNVVVVNGKSDPPARFENIERRQGGKSGRRISRQAAAEKGLSGP